MLRFRYTEKYSDLQNIGGRNQGEGDATAATGCSGLVSRPSGRRLRHRVVQAIVDGRGQELFHLPAGGHEPWALPGAFVRIRRVPGRDDLEVVGLVEALQQLDLQRPWAGAQPVAYLPGQGQGLRGPPGHRLEHGDHVERLGHFSTLDLLHMSRRDPGEQPVERATAEMVDVERVYPNAHDAHDSGQVRLTFS